MAEVKGKFITLTANFLRLYKNKLDEAEEYLYSKTNKRLDDLDPEGWYDTDLYVTFMNKYIEASPTKENALVTLGRNIYPTIKKTTGFPPGLNTPLDYIKFEAEGYRANLRGPEIEPRKFIKEEDGDVVVQLVMKEQPCKTMEGIYAGILEVCDKKGQVRHEKCFNEGDPYCEFHIIWNK